MITICCASLVAEEQVSLMTSKWWPICVSLISGTAQGWYAKADNFGGLTLALVEPTFTCGPGRRGLAYRARRGEQGARPAGGRVRGVGVAKPEQ